ncbi:putative nacht and ankyrin domain protein [Eutypa lata UCREL1]|uniref:Putative nacht and ankyrin domain protein n=1 Tax=Eutypa lata (strain UCR-EL1) TaxID=1287681 RepID=M7TEH3_EUTLA|nr:putative nacht and ankyrin domain protein [Eutypa lata UCREL1]
MTTQSAGIGDSNTYTTGRIGGHNIVLTCLSNYGTGQAAAAASNMLRTFTNIQIGLMVGIGGGVPWDGKNRADIRLGDVVIGTEVVQYDIGKEGPNGFFVPTGRPKEYSYPVAVPDVLFEMAYDHANAYGEYQAMTCDSCDSSRLVSRPKRNHKYPMIHYGTIASGNKVIKHGITRDSIAHDTGAACFEMEAAGLIDAGFPCLVVRGISDYADSHKNKKNKQWQGYAAATAAAYAKELLSIIPIKHRDDPGGQKEKWGEFFNRVRTMELEFLQYLHFGEISERQGGIAKAYQETFEWIYKPPELDQNWSSFTNWLSHEQETYWIAGKPGSGKSTLMRFLELDERTNEYLRVWSGDCQLLTAGFYFWNSGTELQMSIYGLFRSLIYQILQQCPGLIPQLCPERWEVLNMPRHTKDDISPWKLQELRSVLLLLTRERFSHLRFFFMIDGLDEFTGDHFELIEIIRSLVACKHIKACVASRPWVAFQEAFSKRPNLKLEDLTARDIELYVRNSFGANGGFSQDDRIWKNEQLEPLVKGDYLYRCHEIKQRIDSRTMGLLELNNYHKYADYELK